MKTPNSPVKVVVNGLAVVPEYWRSLLAPIALVAAAVALSLVLHVVLFYFLRRISPNQKSLSQSIVRNWAGPMRLIFPLIAVDLALPYLNLPRHTYNTFERIISVGEAAAVTWLLVKLTFVLSDALIAHYEVKEPDPFKARRIVTQIHVFRRVLMVIIIVLACGITLTSFRWGRQIGGSILASAGIAGVAVGLAARPTIENLVAGVQLALTQPIRINDVVIVEGQWGWVEEITTTYVVVRIWNLQRLILPLTYFIQHPFQNWTRQSTNLIGTVHIYADYTIPVQDVREALTQIVKNQAGWDGRVCVLQVTEATEHTVELRALVSAQDSSTLWDLRCAVREKLIEFIQQNYPQCLPKTRAEIVERSRLRLLADDRAACKEKSDGPNVNTQL